MSIFRRAPKRTPHPDPARELELQRILDLRASIGRRATQIAQYRREIGKLLESVRSDTSGKRIEMFRSEIKVLDERINAAEDAITRTGEQIADLQSKMSPDDLAFL